MPITRVPIPALDMRRGALVRGAFSLSGVLPLGAFLVIHAAVNARALAGDASFARAARLFERIPALPLVEVVLVFAPLLVHGALGLWLVATRSSFAVPSPYGGAVHASMRVTGVLALAFLAMHLPELRFRTPGARPAGDLLSSLLAADLASMRYGLPLRAVAYLLGSGAVAFHFAAGLWGFFARTPRGRTPEARRRAAWWAGAVGTTMWLVFANAVVFHATGARLFGRATEEAGSMSADPSDSGGPGNRCATVPPADGAR
jgi:succinate dehydrogenase / fumarate reductase cytochrome b subunit